ncbi:hypothetical protein [Chitinimonas sp.]|uniref:hypothetical protein n=1 Tax=Chitinimonas sp. TaxID=1934313 RepID=UPI0035AD9FF8
MRGLDWRPYRTMLAGLDAFERHHALAPLATLQLQLRPRSADASLAGVTLAIDSASVHIDVPIDVHGSFTLPRHQQAEDEAADLLLNRKRGDFGWLPAIHSPSVPADSRRLGDLRLECEIRWAVERGDAPPTVRDAFAAAGGACHSRLIAVSFAAPYRLAQISLKHAAQEQALPVTLLSPDRKSYTVPLYDTHWPDDTLVLLQADSKPN